ncbi:MAG: hypothetical protein RBS77_04115 [Candidatus Moranbacteria bacterium]|jgi:hypothetical protein|nr:hypothetical protein [Candidatus Moranbacteria bacterium]
MFECLNFNKNRTCIFIFTVLFIIIFGLLLRFFSQLFIAIGDLLNQYSQGIIALTAILGLLFGQSWLDTSKQKMKGKLDYDVARKYLKMVLQLRDAIKKVRNPFISIGEMQVALEKNGFKGDEYEDNEKVNRSVYSLRWNNIQEAWTSFEEVLIEAEVSWGDEAINIQKDLDLLTKELRSVVWLFINYPENFNKKEEGNSKVLYGTHDENDEFAKKINSEIEKIRIFLKKHL